MKLFVGAMQSQIEDCALYRSLGLEVDHAFGEAELLVHLQIGTVPWGSRHKTTRS